MPRLLKLPVGSCDSSLIHRFVRPNARAQPRACEQRRHPLAERDDVGIVAVRQQLAIAPQRFAAGSRSVSLRQRLADRRQIVADPDRAVLVERLRLIGGQVLAVDRAFQMRDKAGHGGRFANGSEKSCDHGSVEVAPKIPGQGIASGRRKPPGTERLKRRWPAFREQVCSRLVLSIAFVTPARRSACASRPGTAAGRRGR